MARGDDEDATPSAWLVLLGDEEVRPDGRHVTEERVPSSLGGVDVGVMSAGELHFVVISDAHRRAVWMRQASQVAKVARCDEQ